MGSNPTVTAGFSSTAPRTMSVAQKDGAIVRIGGIYGPKRGFGAPPHMNPTRHDHHIHHPIDKNAADTAQALRRE